MTKLAKIEVEFGGKWVPHLQDSNTFCKGYWEHLSRGIVSNNFRFVDSSGNITDHLDRTEKILHTYAGLPEAQDYYYWAVQEIKTGLKYKDNRCHNLEELSDLVAQLKDIEQEHKDKECSTNVWTNGQDPKENKND
jgi:HD superfamily phosphohydrolase